MRWAGCLAAMLELPAREAQLLLSLQSDWERHSRQCMCKRPSGHLRSEREKNCRPDVSSRADGSVPPTKRRRCEEVRGEQVGAEACEAGEPSGPVWGSAPESPAGRRCTLCFVSTAFMLGDCFTCTEFGETELGCPTSATVTDVNLLFPYCDRRRRRRL